MEAIEDKRRILFFNALTDPEANEAEIVEGSYLHGKLAEFYGTDLFCWRTLPEFLDGVYRVRVSPLSYTECIGFFWVQENYDIHQRGLIVFVTDTKGLAEAEEAYAAKKPFL